MIKKTLFALTALFIASLLSWAAFSARPTLARDVTVSDIKACYAPGVNSSVCLDKVADASNTNDRGNKNGG